MVKQTITNEIHEDEIVNLKASVENSLQEVTKLSDAEKKNKNEDVKTMIHYFVDATDKVEDRRNRLVELSWQSLAFTVTALGVIFGFKIWLALKILIIIILFILLVFSVLKIREHITQSRFRYPFLRFGEYGNRWKWFYYGNEHIPQISTNPFDVRHKGNDEKNYLKGLDFLVSKYKHETLDTEIRDNILQLYLLQVHNYYKNRFYLRLLAYDKTLEKLLTLFAIIYIEITLILIFMIGTNARILLFKPF